MEKFKVGQTVMLKSWDEIATLQYNHPGLSCPREMWEELYADVFTIKK